MGKSRKQQLQDYQFDEASSGSEDDSDSGDEEDDYKFDEMRQKNALEEEPFKRKDRIETYDSSDDDGDSDASSDSGSDDSTGSESEQQEPQHSGDDVDEDDSDQEEEVESSSDEEDAPLHQRVLRKEGRGSMQRSSRAERKSRALEEATKRLASFKENKKKKLATSAESNEAKSSRNNANEAVVKKKKKNKHKPTEVSSKRADFFARGARRLNESGLGVDIGAHRYKPMDPRASSLSGHFDEDRFHKNYAFLEELRNKEIGQVRKRIAAHKATGKKGNRLRRKMQIIGEDGGHTTTLEEDVARLKVLTETRANLERRKIDRAAKQSVKRKIREDVESGKTGAYFLKRKEKKRLELEARFEEIRKRGGDKAVEKMIAKKRQKNKSRDAGAFAK